MSIKKDKLLISSDFYSIQGEGISSGVPSYFVRLSHCNLSCGMSTMMLNAIKKAGPEAMEDGEIFVGDLHEKGEATWTCDSTSQWAIRGSDQDFDYLIDRWLEEGIYGDVASGLVHIIWTGGEPTMPAHQEAICNFLDHAWNEDERFEPFNEIETNGTFVIGDRLFNQLDQINSSPKLANSGMPAKRRIKPDAIKRIMEHHNYQFKFVVSTEEDIEEVFRDFVEPFQIPLQNVVCMPGLDDQTNFHERTNFIMEMARKYKFRGLTRLHISAWDKTLNV